MQSPSTLPRSYLAFLLAWCGVLFAFFVLTYTLAEPYPTFVMPGFARVFQPERDTMLIEEPRTWLTDDKGHRMDFPYQELWDDLHYVSPPAVMKQLFTSSIHTRLALDTHTPSLYMRMKQLRGIMQSRLHGILQRTTIQERCQDSTTQRWLVKQCVSIIKKKMVAHDKGFIGAIKLHIAWQSNSYTVQSGGLLLVHSRLIDSLTIPLGATAFHSRQLIAP
jgi:hypothetical protein